MRVSQDNWPGVADEYKGFARLKTLVVIPARFGSTRLPGKVLLRAGGKTMLQWVWEQAVRAQRADRVIVATDDPRILEACRGFGAECRMTSKRHASGSSRAAEVARTVRCANVVNVQADEPEIRPSMIDRLVVLLRDAPMSTLAAPIRTPEEYRNPNRVKVVLDGDGYALYFSRAPIPHGAGSACPALLHVGLYGYRRDVLLRMGRWRPHPLERAERLEQLRALARGTRIRVGMIPGPWPGGIDVPADWERFLARQARR